MVCIFLSSFVLDDTGPCGCFPKKVTIFVPFSSGNLFSALRGPSSRIPSSQPLIRNISAAIQSTASIAAICSPRTTKPAVMYVKAGIDGAKSHSGRRTFATRLIQKGADIRCIQVLMGHSSISITARYIQENPIQLSELVKGL